MPAVLQALRLAALAFIAACTTTGEHYLADDAPDGSELRRVLLLPVNFDRETPSSWVPGLEVIGEETERYLSNSGRAVESAALAHVLDHWREAMARTGDLVGPDGRLDPAQVEAAHGALARSLLAASGADALLLAKVERKRTSVTRDYIGDSQARSVKGYLEWDGVKQKVPVVVEGRQYQYYPVDGEFIVASLSIAVIGVTGDRYNEATRGLESLEYIKIEGDRFRSMNVARPFQDEELVRECVRDTLRPYLGAI